MSLFRLHRRIAAWLAILALLASALAPTVVQARMAGGERADWLEICTTTGMAWVKVGAGTDTTAQESGDTAPDPASHSHCPWCTLHGGSAALAPDAVTLPVFPARTIEWVPTPPGTVVATTVWASAQSRAPPLAT
jgi:Protein of unknown function (DUF2946)